MLDFILLLICCILGIEILTKLKLFNIINYIFNIYKKTFRVIYSNKASSFSKERLIRLYSLIIFKKSVATLAIFSLFCLVFFFFIKISNSFSSFLISIKGVIISITISIIYLKIRTLTKK